MWPGAVSLLRLHPIVACRTIAKEGWSSVWSLGSVYARTNIGAIPLRPSTASRGPGSVYAGVVANNSRAQRGFGTPWTVGRIVADTCIWVALGDPDRGIASEMPSI